LENDPRSKNLIFRGCVEILNHSSKYCLKTSYVKIRSYSIIFHFMVAELPKETHHFPVVPPRQVESSLRSEGTKRQALGATRREALEAAERQRAEQMQMERQQREQLQMKQVGMGLGK
jgi:hypothetical protein